jgi:hypothetical protein
MSLRGLFLCTTYFAIASALAARWGLGVFVFAIGAGLTWLSFRGYLGWMQTRAARPRVFGGGWLLVAVSMALPALTTRGCNNQSTTHDGWQLAYAGAMFAGGSAMEFAEHVVQPESWTWENAGEAAGAAVFVLMLNLPNVMVLVSPWLLYRQQRGKGSFGSAVLGCATVSTWIWGTWPGENDELRIGYYVWSAGITLVSLAGRPGWRTLAAMALAGSSLMLWFALAGS